MGRFKTESERIAKRLAAKAEKRRLENEAQINEKLKRPEKIIRRPPPQPDVVNFGQDTLRQKKG